MFLCEWASCVERNALFLVAASACRLGLSADFFPLAAFLRRVILVGSVLSETSSCRPQSKGPEGTAGYSKMVADTLWKKKILRWMKMLRLKFGVYISLPFLQSGTLFLRSFSFSPPSLSPSFPTSVLPCFLPSLLRPLCLLFFFHQRSCSLCRISKCDCTCLYL